MPINNMIVRHVRGHPALLALFGLLFLAACGSDQGPRVDPLVAPQVVDPPPALLYTDEGAQVRVRFRRESGEPAAGLPVVVSGAGTFSGGTLTDAAGEVRGTWTPGSLQGGPPGGAPGGLGPATLSVAVEAQVASLDTEVVTREVVALTLEIPERATAGEPFVLRVTGRDGKGAPPGSGSPAGTVEISGGEGDALTLPLSPSGSEVELTLTAAGARTLRAEHSAGPGAEGTVLVQADTPAELTFMDVSPVGREDDVAVRTPTLHAVDRFGNVVDGEADWTVGGRPQAWPPVATFRNGAFTPDSVQLGSGADAGVFRVFSPEGAASPFSAQASLPVLPRVEVAEVAAPELPTVAFTDAPIVFAFTATGPGGPVAFGRWRATLAGTPAGGGATGETALADEGRVLDAEGRSGPIPLGDLAAGSYDLRIEVDGVAFSRSFSVREPPVPSALLRVAGHEQVAVEGATLAPLRIRVVDQEGEGMAAPVSWSAAGGTIDGASASDASGEAEATWTLPLEPGMHEARARIADLELVFTATATETPVLTEFRIVSGDSQRRLAGATLEAPLVVEARDQFGDPIGGTVTWSGPGAFTPATSTLSAGGQASTSWTLPSEVGAHTATAGLGSMSVAFTAEALAPTPEHPLAIDGHYLVQTIQTEARDRELVADRSALFRGFLVRVNDDAFTARLRVRNGAGTVVETIPLTPPATIPTGTPDRMDQGTTFQATVPASRITPGMSYILEVESDAGVMADTVAPTVVSRGTLPVRFVPIRTDSTGRVGNVNAGNLGDFLGRAEGLPFRGVTGAVRAEYLYGGSPITGVDSTWIPLIQEIYELRLADGSSDLYYGVPHREATSGVAGIGYLGYPVSLGIHASSTSTTQYLFNHEVGHNLNLQHSPCRVSASNSDPDFPFSDGRIGAHGYLQGAVLDPSTPDVMGYCGTHTFGTYHWSKAINYRVPSLVAAAGGAPAYRIWGSVLNGEVTLRGPYVGSDLVADSGPSDGPGGGPGDPGGELQGDGPSGSTIHVMVRDENGAILWSGEAPLMAFDHADGGSFSVPVPVGLIGEDRRAMRIDVEARGVGPPGMERRGRGRLEAIRRSFAVGFDREVPGHTRVPEAEVYRAPDGSVMGFGVRGLTRAPAGALIQDGTPAGLVRAPGTAGQPGPVVGRARDMIRGGGRTR